MTSHIPFKGPNKQLQVKKKLSDGIDCGIKSPFKLTLEIPRKLGLSKSHKTEFFPLHNIPGAKVGLKYYPDKRGKAQICIRIEDDQNRDSFGVAAVAEISRRADDPVVIWDFKKKDLPINKHFHFGGDIQATKEFISDEKNLWKGVEIVVEGFVFIWDESSLRKREDWRFSPGVIGYKKFWEADRFDGHFTFRTGGSAVNVNLAILAKNSPVFRRMLASTEGFGMTYYEIPEESLVHALGLCYDYRMFHKDPISFDIKMDLFRFFSEFQVSNYKQQLEHHLVEYIDYANVGRIAKYGRYGNSEILQKKCLDFIRMCIRNKKFFIVHNFKNNRKILTDALELETYHEWIGAVIEGEEETTTNKN